MRILKNIFLLVWLMSCLGVEAQSQLSKEQKAVYQTALMVGKAWTQNNLDTLEKYIHTDYLHTDVKGQILNRTQWLSYVKDRKEKNVSNPSIEFEEVQISIFGDIALVTGINAFSGQAYTSNDTNTKPRKLRFTQAMKKEGSVWKRILFQATYIETQ